MNTLLTFLRDRRDRLDLNGVAATHRLSCVLMTPRFRASRHVLFFVLPEGSPDPVLVAKVARLAGTSESVEREAANLRGVQAGRIGGFDSIPRVVAFEEYCGRSILIETALVGSPMDPAVMRRDLAGCCQRVTDWLVDVQRATSGPSAADSQWFERLIQGPLDYFEAVFPLSDEESRLVERTRGLAAPLRGSDVRLVVEHGDLSHPNVMRLKGGTSGVVDWELADLCGLPACDLFFFLAYAAFALGKAHASGDFVSAFHRAFFGTSAWTCSFIRGYAERLGIPAALLTPLFVSCWARYTAGLLSRLGGVGRAGKRVGNETATWLRTNRYYALWRHTLEHVDELRW